MVSTTSQVLIRQSGGKGPGSFFERRVVCKQTIRPFSRVPLPYRTELYQVLDEVPPTGEVASSTQDGFSPASYRSYRHNEPTSELLDLIQNTKNKARDAFDKDLGERCEAAVNLAEIRQTAQMVQQRVTQVARFARNLRRLDFKGALRALDIAARGDDEHTKIMRRIKRNPALKSRVFAKDAAGFYLEVHFGMEPLYKDIKSGIDLLTSDVPVGRIISSSKVALSPHGVQALHPYESFDSSHTTQCRVKISADVRVTNPNTWLNGRLGLTNMAGVAFELVPFSFISDWFFNISQVLGSMTPIDGLEITNAFHTVKWKDDCTLLHLRRNTPFGAYNASSVKTTSRSEVFERVLGLPEVRLMLRPAWSLSTARGATAASLVTQLFLSMPETPYLPKGRKPPQTFRGKPFIWPPEHHTNRWFNG